MNDDSRSLREIISRFRKDEINQLELEGLLEQWAQRRRLSVWGVGDALPLIICLCGSTRFVEHFNEARQRLTLEGKIVLSIEIVTTQSREEDPQHADPEVKRRLDELHLRKIDLADEVHVLNVDGYVGPSTQGEIQYARDRDKKVTWLEPDKAWMADTSFGLLQKLGRLSDEYGTMDVALTAARLTDTQGLFERLRSELRHQRDNGEITQTTYEEATWD